MIRSVHGDLLAADADALVNTVNTVGVMGKGLALRFKRTFPDNYASYRTACQRGEVALGTVFVHHSTTLTATPRLIINFPTKGHWRQPSRLADIRAGLVSLLGVVARERVRSIAVPPLGCGNGGLDWRQVRPLIVTALVAVPDLDVQLYEPTRPAGRETGR
jgi:O-acetyl-ADP-ribose deacetylase (regulator of RNase III)